MTLSIIAITASLVFSFLAFLNSFVTKTELRDEIYRLKERLKAIEQYTDKWNSYGEILGYEDKKQNLEWWLGSHIQKTTRRLTKWNALLEYLKIEWKEGKVEAKFEKKK